MADAVKAELMRSDDFNLNSARKIIDNYDVLGFGSGIYSGKHHKSLTDLVSVLPENIHEKVFSTFIYFYFNWIRWNFCCPIYFWRR